MRYFIKIFILFIVACNFKLKSCQPIILEKNPDIIKIKRMELNNRKFFEFVEYPKAQNFYFPRQETIANLC